MYTLETLIPDCVGRYITNPGGAVQLASLINGRSYAKCWQALIYWLVNQYDLGHSTNLTPLGAIIRKGGDTSFRFLRSFVEKFNLVCKSGDLLDSEDDSSAMRMNIASLSKLAGVPPQTFRLALSHLFRRLGEILQNKEQVLIDFSLGSLVGDKGEVDFVFHDSPSGEHKHATPDPRLLSKGAKAGSPRISVETSRLRSKYQLQTSPTSAKSAKDFSALMNTPASEQKTPGNSVAGLPNSSGARFKRLLKVLYHY